MTHRHRHRPTAGPTLRLDVPMLEPDDELVHRLAAVASSAPRAAARTSVSRTGWRAGLAAAGAVAVVGGGAWGATAVIGQHDAPPPAHHHAPGPATPHAHPSSSDATSPAAPSSDAGQAAPHRTPLAPSPAPGKHSVQPPADHPSSGPPTGHDHREQGQHAGQAGHGPRGASHGESDAHHGDAGTDHGQGPRNANGQARGNGRDGGQAPGNGQAPGSGQASGNGNGTGQGRGRAEAAAARSVGG